MVLSTPALVVNGLIGGLVGTVLMTVVMNLLADDAKPPTVPLLHEFLGSEGDSPDDYFAPGMVLHFLYGTGSGGVLGAIAGVATLGLGPEAPLLSVAASLVWAVLLLVGGMVVWINLVLGLDRTSEQKRTFVIVHLVYGLTLGVALAVLPALV